MTDRFFRQSLIALFLSAIIIIFIGRYTNIDLILSDWMYSDTLHTFPWKETWFGAIFIHIWMKYFFIMIGLAMAGALIKDHFLSRKFSSDTRRKLLVVVLSSIIIPLAIGFIKSRSAHHCPWDVARYGGFAPYLHIFDTLPKGIKAGHCFPAGHASSALWIAAFSVFWLDKGPRSTITAFVIGLLPGLTFGWVQQMRGAHFLTHTLWSTWIASLIILLLTRALLPASSSVSLKPIVQAQNGVY